MLSKAGQQASVAVPHKALVGLAADKVGTKGLLKGRGRLLRLNGAR